MSILGMRRWPAPVCTFLREASINGRPLMRETKHHANNLAIVKPMWPFFAAGIFVMYGVNTIQDAVTGGGAAKDDKAKKNAADH
ncbi:hypothetical protein E4U19_003991 [Claviceps sp. Clav32 group G5]|nr:hypothetical protein E4U40_003877 [Claviceps sp. LM458 group G5]KAG6024044.1 hypothetical protein E4U19_003991 [Claviceps sp. Clav32 group G5]